MVSVNLLYEVKVKQQISYFTLGEESKIKNFLFSTRSSYGA